MSSGMPNLNLIFGQKISDIKAGKFDDETTETTTTTTTTKESSEHDKAIAKKSLAYGNQILNSCLGKSSSINNLCNSNFSYQYNDNDNYSSSSSGNIFNNDLFNSFGNISINEENFFNWLKDFFKTDKA